MLETVIDGILKFGVVAFFIAVAKTLPFSGADWWNITEAAFGMLVLMCLISVGIAKTRTNNN